MSSNLNDQITLAYKLSNNSHSKIINVLSEKYGLNLIPVEKLSVDKDLPLIRITKNHLYLEHNKHTLFFHPSMALLRMVNIKRGIGDRFLKAIAVTEGDILLDATMGLASDALIASWAVGERGKVIALEYSPLVFMLVNEGLERLEKLKPPKVPNLEKKQAWLELAKASTRIKSMCANHQKIIEELPDSSVDVIYFDPMFRNTLTSSSSIKPLKEWSYPKPLSIETIKQACRVARKRVVLKERKNGKEFERLGFKLLEGSRYNPVGFGIIDLIERKECAPCNR
jgi:16S rRNA (guanine1516-N2)-methyltransferase